MIIVNTKRSYKTYPRISKSYKEKLSVIREVIIQFKFRNVNKKNFVVEKQIFVLLFNIFIVYFYS